MKLVGRRPWPTVIGLVCLIYVASLAGGFGVAHAANPIVKGISVEGLHNIPADVVLGAVKNTKVGEEVSEDVVKKDLESIMSLGYFSDLRARFAQVDGGVNVVFEVTENPILKDIVFIGDSTLPSDALKQAMGLETGQILNTNKLNEGIHKALDKAANDYGIAARVSDITFSADGIVKIKLSETKIGKIEISGNQKTKEYVIRRELNLAPGDPLNLKTLKNDLRHVLNLGFFDEVGQKFTPTKDPDVTDLTIDVKERKTGSAAGGVGYSSADGLIGYLEYNEDNLLGTGQRLNAKWEFGANTNTYNLGFYQPYLDANRTSLGVNLYNQNRTYKQGGDSFTDHKIGGDITVGRPLSENTRGYLKLTSSYNQHYQGDEVAEENLDTEGRVNSVETSFVNDTRDFVLSPSSGGRRELSVEYAGLRGDYNFIKYSTDLSQYLKAGKSGVVAFHLGAGKLVNTGSEYPSFEQFTVGGADSVRGYEDNQFSGDKMLVLNAEYRLKLSKGLTGVVFADAGNAWVEGDSMKLGDLKSGYGVGIRVDTPVGVMRIDYGVPEGGGSGKTYFSLGQTF